MHSLQILYNRGGLELSKEMGSLVDESNPCLAGMGSRALVTKQQPLVSSMKLNEFPELSEVNEFYFLFPEVKALSLRFGESGSYCFRRNWK